MTKQEKLSEIFDRIHKLNVCGRDNLKVRRDVTATNIDSKIMVIAEAMAPEQVRLSGINYFYKDGKIGSTGKYFEKFLNKFDYTVYPSKEKCIYHTEIVHNFPGYKISKGKKSIRRPTKQEIKESIESNILRDEIDLIQPKLILLMGSTAYHTFYKYILNINVKRNLTEEIERISKTGEYSMYNNIPIIPIQHSSGANPRFNSMLKNEKLIQLIRKIVNA